MKYEHSEEWTLKAKEIAKKLGYSHIDSERIVCIKSQGTKTRRTVARIHALGKVMQLGMNVPAFYTIELITELFDRQSREEQEKTVIHELMHIPRSFGGGFRHHNIVNRHTVEKAYQAYQKAQQ